MLRRTGPSLRILMAEPTAPTVPTYLTVCALAEKAGIDLEDGWRTGVAEIGSPDRGRRCEWNRQS